MAENSLFIGIIETEEEIEDQLNDWKCNKIGGFPVFSPFCKTDIISNTKSLVCDSCQNMLTFLLQINCPIDESLNDRVLYLFVCTNSECHQNKWIALRSVTPFVDIKCEKQSDNDVKKNSWIQTETEWDDNHYEHKQSQHSSTNESIDSTQQMSNKCLPISDQSMAYFKPFYMSVIDEPLEDNTNDKHIKQLIQLYDSHKNKLNSDKNMAEAYEKNYINTIYGNDKKTYKFFKRLSQCPQQIIRYEWEGIPLLNSENCKPVVSKCDLCGSDRCFELQLMPALITHLKPLSDTANVIDFGTALIYTCSKNCNIKLSPFAIEQCIVFSDPDNELINKNKNISEK